MCGSVTVSRLQTAAGGAGGNQRRQRLAQDFLAWMDQMGDLLSLAERQEVDPVKQERMEVRGRSCVPTLIPSSLGFFFFYSLKILTKLLDWILSGWTVRPGTWTRLSTLSSVRVGS